MPVGEGEPNIESTDATLHPNSEGGPLIERTEVRLYEDGGVEYILAFPDKRLNGLHVFRWPNGDLVAKDKTTIHIDGSVEYSDGTYESAQDFIDRQNQLLEMLAQKKNTIYSYSDLLVSG
jgi:hypothetical protein